MIIFYPLFPKLLLRVLDPLGQRGRTEPGVPGVLVLDVACELGVLVVNCVLGVTVVDCELGELVVD